MAEGGLDQDVSDAIFATKPVRIETFGSSSATVTDSQGVDHSIEFTRPGLVDIFVDLTVVTDPATFPIDGVAQIEQALVDLGEALLIGDDIVALSFKCEPLKIDGVLDVPVFFIDTSASPTGTTNIVIALRDLAKFDVTRINVTVT